VALSRYCSREIIRAVSLRSKQRIGLSIDAREERNTFHRKIRAGDSCVIFPVESKKSPRLAEIQTLDQTERKREREIRQSRRDLRDAPFPGARDSADLADARVVRLHPAWIRVLATGAIRRQSRGCIPEIRSARILARFLFPAVVSTSPRRSSFPQRSLERQRELRSLSPRPQLLSQGQFYIYIYIRPPRF